MTVIHSWSLGLFYIKAVENSQNRMHNSCKMRGETKLQNKNIDYEKMVIYRIIANDCYSL